MNLTDYIERQVNAKRTAAFSASDQLSLGDLIAECKRIRAETDRESLGVVFDFEYLYPTYIDSWRGIYSELALAFSSDTMKDPPTLDDFIAMLESAVGKTFGGYKGGEYVMSEATPLWVANYGHSGNTAVVGVIDAGWQVIIATGYRESF